MGRSNRAKLNELAVDEVHEHVHDKRRSPLSIVAPLVGTDFDSIVVRLGLNVHAEGRGGQRLKRELGLLDVSSILSTLLHSPY